MYFTDKLAHKNRQEKKSEVGKLSFVRSGTQFSPLREERDAVGRKIRNVPSLQTETQITRCQGNQEVPPVYT